MASVEVPYQRDGKLPMVEVRIDGKGPFWFVVDSGASRTVLDARLASELGLEVTGRGATTGTGSGAVPLAFVGGVSVALGDVAYRAEPYVIDMRGVPLDKRVRGLIGSELFATRVVRLDPVRQVIAVSDAAPELPAGAAALPLRVAQGKLYMPVTLEVRPGQVVEREVRIDTGSESTINDPAAADAELTASQTLGGGLGENFEGVSGKFDAVRIGPYRIAAAWGPGGSPSAIGMELLQRFVVTFDAPRADPASAG